MASTAQGSWAHNLLNHVHVRHDLFLRTVDAASGSIHTRVLMETTAYFGLSTNMNE